MKIILPALLLLAWNAFALEESTPTISLSLQAEAPAVKPPKTVWFGHNLSQSTAILGHGECSAGLQIVACGAYDRVTVGSSPFIWSVYELPNLFVRFGERDGSGYGRYALQVAHVGTAEERDIGYMMSVSSVWFIAKIYQTPTSSIFFNGVAAYYWDDTMPYSLRRPQPNPTPLQLSSTVAFTAKIAPLLSLNAETGILGLNEDFPHIHTGATLGFHHSRFAGHFGISFDGTWEALWSGEKTDRWQERKYAVSYSRQAASNGVYSPPVSRITNAEASNDLGFHPEVALQVFF